MHRAKHSWGGLNLQLWVADNRLLSLGVMEHNEEFSSYRTLLRVGQIICDPGALATNKRGSKEPPCAFCTWFRPLPPREPQFYLSAFKGQCVEHFAKTQAVRGSHTLHIETIFQICRDPREIQRAAIEERTAAQTYFVNVITLSSCHHSQT